MKNVKILILIFLCGFVYSCDNSPQTKSYWVDNPTDKEITVIIDNNNYVIPALSGQNVMLPYGKHALTYNNESVNFMLVPCDQSVVINPTLSNYVLFYKMYYNVDKGLNEKEVANMQSAYVHPLVKEAGDTIMVPFQVLNPLFIERYQYYWNLGLGESLGDNIKLEYVGSADDLSTVKRSKLFREKDFLTYSEMSNDIKLPVEYKSFKDFKPISLFDDLEKCDCEDGQQYIELQKARFDSLQVAQNIEDIKHLMSKLKGIGDDTSALDHCRQEGSNYVKVFSKMKKEIKDKLGAKNALIIK